MDAEAGAGCLIYIGTPTYDGKLHSTTVAGLLDLRHICSVNNVGFAMDVLPGNAFVGHARNQVAQRFMDSGFRDLMFIDADIGFNALDVVSLCKAEPEIVFGLYLMKQSKPQYPGLFVDPLERHPSDSRLLKMQYGPTGFMRVRKEVFEAMMKRWPDDWYIDGATKDKTYDFFPGGRHGNNFMSEDIAFCHKAREVGFDLWAMQDIPLKHTGSKTWDSNWQMDVVQIEEAKAA